jgi:hypothetical protein
MSVNALVTTVNSELCVPSSRRNMKIRMRRCLLLRPVALALLCNFAVAQMSTLPAAKAIAELPGPPTNPPIFSQMTVIMQGGLDYQDTVDMKGLVSGVERELTDPRQSSRPYRKTTLKFDDDGRLIKRVDEDSLGVSTTTNVWVSGRLQDQNVSHHRNDGKFANWNEWQRWTYDKNGRLAEFKAGRDKQEMNDYVNFKYDPRGRPLGYELYAQTLTEISYDDNKITLSRMQEYGRRKFFEQVQLVEDAKRVVDLKVSDLSGGQLTQWYHVKFKYDEKGRVVEQNTDPFKMGSGDDYSPLPGKLVVEYNDEKHSGEQKFYDTEGKLVLRTSFTFDRDGIFTKLRVLDASDKEQTGSEIFVDPQFKSSIHAGNVEWEIIYDDHGNWTERRRWFTPADGSPRIMTRLVHQNITYR